MKSVGVRQTRPSAYSLNSGAILVALVVLYRLDRLPEGGEDATVATGD